MYQAWLDLTFIHWPYPVDVLQRLLPPQVKVDTFEGQAWVGLVPFRIEGLRPPFLPSMPWISSFPETNVRTYVIGPDGSRGVWFFTLEADQPVAVAGARLFLGLPYRWASMRLTRCNREIVYKSSRQQASSHIVIEAGPELVANDLDHFLTARFRLFCMLRGKLRFIDVEHAPWPLAEARIVSMSQNITESLSLGQPAGVPLVRFSEGVHTTVSPLRDVVTPED